MEKIKCSNTVTQWFSSRGDFVPWGRLAVSENLVGCYNWSRGLLVTSSGQRSWILPKTLNFRNIMNFYWNSYHFQRQQKSKVHWHRWYWCPAHISSLLTQLSTCSTCIFTSISWGQKCQGISSKSNPQQMIDRNNSQISQSLGESNTEMCISHWLTFLQEDQVQPPQWWMA